MRNAAPAASIEAIRRYWNEHIHDLKMTRHPVGTREFFDDLDAYRFDKLHYLPHIVNFHAYGGRTLLEVGCGIGTDLLRFARGGARATAVDLSETAIGLARANFDLHGMPGIQLAVANAEALPFPTEFFDVVYGHGVVQYTADPEQLIAECRRVLKPGGEAIFMVYNRHSWLHALSKVTRVELEHEDAPVLRKYTIPEFRRLLSDFHDVRIIPDRFPVASRLHHGWKALLYNGLFVRAFNTLPRAWVRPFGWHLMASCRK
jgi:ubiquinone/menaquinone biosynthesis C-methylase UbiE